MTFRSASSAFVAVLTAFFLVGCPSTDDLSDPGGSDGGSGADAGSDTAPVDTDGPTQDGGTDATDTQGDTCQPTTCEAAGAQCGTVDDGCGGELDCGGCEEPETCGAKMPNQCGCVSETDEEFCTRVGATCGEVTAPDNCGRERTVDSCGSCRDYETCNDQNACQCEPKDDATLCKERAVECGTTTVTGRCGDVEITCATCDQYPNSTCEQNSCTCKPKSCQNMPGTCGVVKDGCGGTINCTGGCSDFLATGGYHTCYQDPMGTIQCWGWNKHGQLGTGSAATNKHNTPQTVATTFNSPTSLTAGEDMTCVVDRGDAKCWGANYHGQALGYQTNRRGQTVKKVLMPTSARVPGVGIKTIEAQVQHTCAITSSDKLYCWGFNWPVANGSLDGSGSTAITPTQYTFGMSQTVRQVDAGTLHTCAETTYGEMWCFGNDFFGGIGDGGGQPLSYQPPTKVMGFAMGFSQVESGGMDTNKGGGSASLSHDFSCAIDFAGAAKCWGSDADGELGNLATKMTRTGNAAEPAPVQVEGLNADVTDLALGGSHACAVQNNGLYCWGGNDYGQLGDGTTTERAKPVKIAMPGGATVRNVEAGFFHTCAELANGKVACWGRNKEGQLGDGTYKRRKTPTVVIP